MWFLISVSFLVFFSQAIQFKLQELLNHSTLQLPSTLMKFSQQKENESNNLVKAIMRPRNFAVYVAKHSRRNQCFSITVGQSVRRLLNLIQTKQCCLQNVTRCHLQILKY
eukprot:TCONS_00047529-protein